MEGEEVVALVSPPSHLLLYSQFTFPPISSSKDSHASHPHSSRAPLNNIKPFFISQSSSLQASSFASSIQKASHSTNSSPFPLSVSSSQLPYNISPTSHPPSPPKSPTAPSPNPLPTNSFQSSSPIFLPSSPVTLPNSPDVSCQSPMSSSSTKPFSLQSSHSLLILILNAHSLFPKLDDLILLCSACSLSLYYLHF